MKAGQLVGERFEIERRVGSGGMGAVYRARDRRTGRVVAVKVLHGHALDHSSRFTREAELLAGLSHDCIVAYIAHGNSEDGEGYMVMEWLEGHDLSHALRAGALGVAATLVLARRVAEGLALAHGHGIVHRDLKPANLFLERGAVERVKILDFGLARAVEGAEKITNTGDMLGTPGYMAPEQARGQKGIDARADVFALGSVLFRCLTGEPAFRGEMAMAVLMSTITAPVPRVASLCPDVPPGLDELVDQMLAKDPALRPRDGAAVLAALDAIAASPANAPARFPQAYPPLEGASPSMIETAIRAPAPTPGAWGQMVAPPAPNPGSFPASPSYATPVGYSHSVSPAPHHAPSSPTAMQPFPTPPPAASASAGRVPGVVLAVLAAAVLALAMVGAVGMALFFRGEDRSARGGGDSNVVVTTVASPRDADVEDDVFCPPNARCKAIRAPDWAHVDVKAIFPEARILAGLWGDKPVLRQIAAEHVRGGLLDLRDDKNGLVFFFSVTPRSAPAGGQSRTTIISISRMDKLLLSTDASDTVDIKMYPPVADPGCWTPDVLRIALADGVPRDAEYSYYYVGKEPRWLLSIDDRRSIRRELHGSTCAVISR